MKELLVYDQITAVVINTIVDDKEIGIVRLEPDTMNELSICEGDTLMVIGEVVNNAKALPYQA